MADKGVWTLCARKPSEIIYLNLGPTQGPLVIYRIHNNGPCAVTVGGAIHLDPRDDCDVSGSRIEVALAGFPLCGPRPHVEGDACSDAAGTYELLCCEPIPQIGAAPAPPPGGNGNAGGVAPGV